MTNNPEKSPHLAADLPLEEKVRRVAEAYSKGYEILAEERIRELDDLPPETLAEQRAALLDLGVRFLPKTPGEWEEFDAGRELVAYQKNAVLAAKRMGILPE